MKLTLTALSTTGAERNWRCDFTTGRVKATALRGAVCMQIILREAMSMSMDRWEWVTFDVNEGINVGLDMIIQARHACLFLNEPIASGGQVLRRYRQQEQACF